MKARQLLLIIATITIANNVQAQDYNPFKSIGKKGKVLTLSKGKYVEFFDTDSVQRIGTVLFNIRTKKIVKLLNAQQVYKKASDNSSASRWWSPDPLAEKYASLSPYAAMANNPILFSDVDGRDLIVMGDPKLQDEYARMLTSTTGRQISINHETGRVSIGDAVNNSGKTSAILNKVLDDVVRSNYAYQVSLTGGSGDDNGVFIDSYTQAKIDIADLKTVEKGTDKSFLSGVLGHFLFEIFSTDKYSEKTDKEREGTFEDAHNKALSKEGEIVGGLLGIGTDARITQPEQVSGADAKEQNVIFSYGGNSDKIVKYLLKQGVTSVTVTKGTMNIGGVDIPTTTYETVTNGNLKKAKKVNE